MPAPTTYQRSAPSPNRRASDAAWKLGDLLAPRITTVLAHLRRELAIVDGWGGATMSDGMPRGSSDLTGVERAADARLTIGQHLAQIEDDLNAVCSLIDSLGHTLERASRLRAPEKPLDAPVACRDAQPGRDGALEWGDPLCTSLAVKAGLCSACYQRERRWRLEHDLSERGAA